jgi:hypothetical protein
MTTIGYVGLARDIKDFVLRVTVKYASDDLKTKLFTADDNDFLMLKNSIGSTITILSVDLVDDAFVRKAVLGS